MTKLIPKCQYNSGNAFGKLSSLQMKMTPTDKKDFKGDPIYKYVDPVSQDAVEYTTDLDGNIVEALDYDSKIYPTSPSFSTYYAELPEVVATPNKESTQAVQRAKEMFPDKQMRDRILLHMSYPKVSQVDVINRLYPFYVKGGKPEVDAVSRIFTGNRPHYNPVGNTIHLGKYPSLKNYIAELSHAMQFARPGQWGEAVKDVVTNPIEYFKNLGSEGDSTVYRRKGSLEHEAHKVIEPKIQRAINDE